MLVLDTMIASIMVKSDAFRDKTAAYSPSEITISSITESEIRYGLAKSPKATTVKRLAEAFLRTIQIKTFDSHAATHYAELRALYERRGFSVGAFDGLIAAHARSLDATLITRDKAILRLKPFMQVNEW